MTSSNARQECAFSRRFPPVKRLLTPQTPGIGKEQKHWSLAPSFSSQKEQHLQAVFFWTAYALKTDYGPSYAFQDGRYAAHFLAKPATISFISWPPFD
ncbi:MAG: hypothetical protein WA174_00235 [Rhodoferax sp.]